MRCCCGSVSRIAPRAPAEDSPQRALILSTGFAEFLDVTPTAWVRRQPWLEKVTWSLIIDEAQAIKNAGCSSRGP